MPAAGAIIGRGGIIYDFSELGPGIENETSMRHEEELNFEGAKGDAP